MKTITHTTLEAGATVAPDVARRWIDRLERVPDDHLLRVLDRLAFLATISGVLGASTQHGGRRTVLNDGATWSEAIRLVLLRHPAGLTTGMIADELLRYGRKFPERSHPTSYVAAVLNARAAALGIAKRGDRWCLRMARAPEGRA